MVVLDATAGKRLWHAELSGGASPAAIAFAPEAGWLLLCDLDDTMRLMELEDGRLVSRTLEERQALFGPAWSPDGSLVLVTSRRAIAIRDLPALDLVCRHAFDRSEIVSAWWRVDGSVAAVLGDGTFCRLRLEQA